jgi:predicted permease
MRIRLKQQRLIDILAQSHITQNHWAIKLGLSRGHLSDLVNGKHPYPSPKTRDKLLIGLGLTFDDLFEVDTDGDDWTYASSASFQAAMGDRYVVDRKVGQGGMGTVYLGRDVKLGRIVAVKVISPEVVSGIGTGEFLKEIRLAARLEHPNILTLLDSDEAAGYPYYIMRYVRGGSLRDLLLQRHRLSLSEALSIFKGVAAGLAEAHANRIIHCDVKPENILLAGNHAYVSDFGISRAVHAEVRAWGRRQELDSSAGTPAYVSPEQAAGEPNLDARTDVYSLACVLYEMLSGTPPFTGTNTLAIVTKRFTDDVPDLAEVVPTVPSGVSSAIRRGMSLDRARRFGSVEEFATTVVNAARNSVTVLSVFGVGWTRLRHAFHGGVSGRPKTAKGIRAMSVFMQDFRYALRSMARRPGQTVVLLATLAVGIGVNSAIFSIVNAVLLRPLPYPEPDRLLTIEEITDVGHGRAALTYPNFADVRDQTTTLAAIAAYAGGEEQVAGGIAPVRTDAYWVTEPFFRALGIAPLLGTVRVADADASSIPVVIGYGLWQSSFGGDVNVVGRRVTISGAEATITGVAPPGFSYPRGAEVWSPLDMDDMFGPSRTAHNVRSIARLAPNTALSSLRAELQGLSARLHDAYPDEIGENFTFAATPLHERLTGSSRGTVILLFSVVSVVLIIACVNIASILMSQAVARRKEIAIRRAVGAGTGRVVGQLLTESVTLGVAGAVLGLTMAVLSIRTLNARVPPSFLPSGPIALDWRVVGFTVLLGVGTGICFGLLPAIRAARGDSVEMLRTDGSEIVIGGRRLRLGGVFVVPQYAFSLAALIVAGLIVKSLITLSEVDPGFEASHLVTVGIQLPYASPSPYKDGERVIGFYQNLLERAGAVPGVSSVTLDVAPPLTGNCCLNGGAQIEGAAVDEWPFYPDWRVVGADYFRTMGIPLLRGRDFSARDGHEATPVVILNQRAATEMFGDADPLGRKIRLSSLDNHEDESDRWLNVIGVV